MVPQFIEVIGPAFWASYLVNGDASGLTADEKARADAWLARESVRVVSTADDTEWFTNALDIYAPECGYRAGSAITYLAEVR